jgi:spermidine synthase
LYIDGIPGQEATQEDAAAQVPEDAQEIPTAQQVTRLAGSAPAGVWIGEDEGQTALLVDGVVQSVYVDDGPLGPGYWPLMLPDARPRSALILGLGGGTIPHLLTRKFGPVRIVGVERDPRVLRLARSAFRVEQCTSEIVEADAFAFVSEAEGPFDYISVDLFSEGGIPRAAFGRPFLKDVKRLLSPGGLAAVNFFKDRRAPDRVQRLERVFPRVEVVASRKNLVARCRPR